MAATIIQINPKADPCYASVPSAAGGSLAVTPLKTATYTAVIGDLVRCDPTAGAFTINLPAASAGSGEILVKVQSASNNGVTVDGIAGVTTALLAREYITLFSDGVSDWMVIT